MNEKEKEHVTGLSVSLPTLMATWSTEKQACCFWPVLGWARVFRVIQTGLAGRDTRCGQRSLGFLWMTE